MTRDEVAAQARKRLTPAGRAIFDRWVAAGYADDVQVSGAICRWYIRWLQAEPEPWEAHLDRKSLIAAHYEEIRRRVAKASDEAGTRDADNETGNNTTHGAYGTRYGPG